MTAGKAVNVNSLLCAEIVVKLLAPFAVFLFKCGLRDSADTFAVPEGFDEIDPFLAAVSSCGA